MIKGCCALVGLFNMLSDSSHEIRQQADQALAEFLQEIKNAPVSAESYCSDQYFIYEPWARIQARSNSLDS